MRSRHSSDIIKVVREFTKIERLPAYGPAEAARYVRLPAAKASRWAKVLGGGNTEQTFPISFVNLLELHVLKAMRIKHALPMPRIKRALTELQQQYGCEYPLLQRNFLTDGLNLLIKQDDSIINLSRSSQQVIQEVVDVYLRRIEIGTHAAKLYPFVASEEANEPRDIVISANLSFGRPVIAGTGISTEIIAARFQARESISDLADEYGLSPQKVEEAIRWESNFSNVAA